MTAASLHRSGPARVAVATPGVVVLYDGDCGICARVAAAFGRGSGDPVSWRPWQREASLPPGVTASRLERELVLVDGSGRVESGAAAFAAIFRTRPALRWLGVLMGAPGISILARVIYAAVARNRRGLSRLLGQRACGLPRAE